MKVPERLNGTFLLWVSCAMLFVGLWQLEMVFVGQATGWGYRFFWLPRIGELWHWRDFWYIIIFVAFLLQAYSLLKRG